MDEAMEEDSLGWEEAGDEEMDGAISYANFMQAVDEGNPSLAKALRECDGLGLVLHKALARVIRVRGAEGLVAAGAGKGDLLDLAELRDAFEEVSLGRCWTPVDGPADRERMVAAAGVQRIAAEEALAAGLVAERDGPFAAAVARVPGLESISGTMKDFLCRSLFKRAQQGRPRLSPVSAVESAADGRYEGTAVVKESLDSLGDPTYGEIGDVDPLDPKRKEVLSETRRLRGEGFRLPALAAFGREAARVPGMTPMSEDFEFRLYSEVRRVRLGWSARGAEQEVWGCSKDPCDLVKGAAQGKRAEAGIVRDALACLADPERNRHMSSLFPFLHREGKAVLERVVACSGLEARERALEASAGQGMGG